MNARLFRTAVLFLAAIALTLVFFRVQFLNGFTFLFGDRFDGMIELSILEHWYNVFRGLEHWSETNYFYPHALTLAYNDGYFLHGVIYALFRWLGCDPFLSSELVNIVLRNIGFFAAFAAMRRCVGTSFSWSLLAASIFSLANASFLHAGHAQLLGIAFVPLMALLLHEAILAFKAGHKTALFLWGSAAAILYAAWVLSGYYIAWFLAYFIMVYALVWVMRGRKQYPFPWQKLRANIGPLIGIAVVALVALLPFLIVYVPKSIETAHNHTASWTPAFLDIINVGYGNILYGGLTHQLDAWIRPAFLTQVTYEYTTGFPLALLALFGGAVWQWWRHPSESHPWVTKLLLATILISWILTLHIIGVTHRVWTLWKYAHMVFPGAAGIRTAARYQIFLLVPMIAIVVAWLSTQAARWPRALTVAVVTLLLVEQINLSPPIYLDRIRELQRLTSLPSPPPGCQAFYVAVPREGVGPKPDAAISYSPNVDAMLIAEIVHVPTINGISSYNPPDWNFTNITTPDYLPHVRDYVAAHHLQGVCGLDAEKLSWRTGEF